MTHNKKIIFVFCYKYYLYPYIIFHKLLGYKILYWQRENKKRSELLDFLNSSQFYPLQKLMRESLDDYFKIHIKSKYNDEILIDYIIKTTSLSSVSSYGYQDYYFFMKSIESKYKNIEDAKIIAPNYLKSIYFNTPPKINFFYTLGYIFQIFLSLLKILKCITQCIKSNIFYDTDDAPDIMYVRKKISPDPHAYSYLSEYFSKKKIEFDGIYPLFSWEQSRHGVKFLNGFKSSASNAIVSLPKLLKFFKKDIIFLVNNGLHPKFVYLYITQSYYSFCLTELGSKILYGVLSEDAVNTLVYRYKNEYQKINSMLDGIYLPPAWAYDYCYHDTFYTTNKLELSTLNLKGGSIANSFDVGFLRGGIKANSNGVSSDLLTKINEYSDTIIIPLASVSNEKYYMYNSYDLVRFIEEILLAAKSNTDKLFVIKGKKGELKFLTKELKDVMSRCDNIYVVKSDSPKTLKYNQFEDLLEYASLVISMTFHSTTVWQTLWRRIPVIACNDIHENSFLKKYKNLEVKFTELKKSIDYWLNISNKDFDKFLCMLNNDVMFLNEYPYKIIADDLYSTYCEKYS